MAVKTNDSAKGTSSPSQPTSVPAEETKPEQRWLVMVYMAADNNLAEECVFSLTEIQRTLQSDEIAVVAQFDSRVKGIATKRYKFRPVTSATGSHPRLSEAEDPFPVDPLAESLPHFASSFSSENKADALPPLHDENSAAPAVLESFLTTSIKKHPATRSLVILSGHGSGVFDGFLTDNDPPGSLSIPNLGLALCNVKKIGGKEIDILGMDSCLMSMIEVCHELSGTVRYLVGSEGFSLSGGWPYRNILEVLQSSKPGAASLAKTIVKEYIHYYSDYVAAGISVDQSACDLSKSSAVVKAVQVLVDLLTEETKGQINLKESVTSPLIVAHWKAQSYEFEQFVDLKDFCELLKEECKDKKVQQACQGVIEAVDDMVLIFGYCGGLTQYSNGLSIYFPWAKSELETIREYQNLRFAKESRWGLFLAAYVKGTQRELRSEATKFQAGEPTLLPVTPPNDSPATVRTNNAAGTKTNNAAGTKTNNAAGTKTNNPAGTKSVLVVAPPMKNPPDYFFDYPKNCDDVKNE